MISTSISTLFLFPGAQMDNVAPSDDLIHESECRGWIIDEALGGYIWAPAREKGKRLNKIDDVKVDEKGVLLESLFAVTGIVEIVALDEERWMTDHMANGDWADLEYAIEAIYDIAVRWLPESKAGKDPVQYTCVDIIGLWHAEGSTTWEEGYQIDQIIFDGEGKIVPVDA